MRGPTRPGTPTSLDQQEKLMATVELTAQNIESKITENGIVFVDFWAEWCGPCRMFGPIFEKASQEHTDVVFGKVDTEAEQALAASAGITSIPTLMAFRDGILVFSQPGALPAPTFEDLIGQVKGLDMDAVRESIAEAKAAEPAPEA
jgi:thioredoxin 1